MRDLNKFGMERLEYLKRQKPQVLKELQDDGILEEHLLHAQRRASWQLDYLVMSGLDECKAEEIVLREIILA